MTQASVDPSSAAHVGEHDIRCSSRMLHGRFSPRKYSRYVCGTTLRSTRSTGGGCHGVFVELIHFGRGNHRRRARLRCRHRCAHDQIRVVEGRYRGRSEPGRTSVALPTVACCRSASGGAQGKSGATCCCHASYRGCGGASPRSCFLGSARAAQGGYPKRSGGKTAGADTTGRLSQSAASPAGEAGRAPGPARQALRGTQDA